jgi:hypothetical protein
MKKLLILLLITIPLITFSQINKDGIPLTDHYDEEITGEAGQIWAITQDKRGVMYFGTNFGLKTFDGKNWKSYNLPNTTIVRSLATDENGLVYYGAEIDFGVILPDEKGELSFLSIFLNKYSVDSIDFGSVWKTIVTNKKLYFQSFEKIYYLDLPLKFDDEMKIKNELKEIKPEQPSAFHLAFSVFDEYYVREWVKGLCKVTEGKTELIPGGEQFAFTRIYIMLPFDEKRILIGTRESGFFIYDPDKKENAITPFELNDQEKIINSVIYTGTKLQDGSFAVGTFTNGLIIFDKTGKITAHLNKNTGMPEQFIHSVYCNEDKNYPHLWFAYEDYGIYKADVTGPFKQWNEYSGLIGGTVFDLIRYKGVLYAAMNNGLFYLDEKDRKIPHFKLIAELEYIFDLEIFTNPENGEEKLMISSYSGIFELNGFELIPIIKEIRSSELYQSVSVPSRLFIGFDQGFGYIEYSNNSWSDFVQIDLKEGYDIKSILESENFIALGTGTRGVLLLDNLEAKNITLIDSAKGLPLLGQDFWLYNFDEKIIVASGAGLYSLEDSLAKPYTGLGDQYTEKKYGVSRFIETEDAIWMTVYETNTDDANFQLIRFLKAENLKKDSIFAKMIPQKTTYALYGEGDNVWVGNPKGLFKFKKNIAKNYMNEFNTLITRVVTGNDSLLFAGNYFQRNNGVYTIISEQDPADKPILQYKNNKVLFEWATPFFEKEDEIQFSYRLVGETEKWSKWGTKNDTRYTNLYEGDYTFEVKARNIYNIESSVAHYSFTILPPWYRTVWALIIFSVLVILAIVIIIRLYTRKLKKENEKLEQIVKERTAEIRMQNEEITAQRDEIQAQKEQVEKAKDKIEKQQKSIMDSIHYASRIQEAVLPPDEYLHQILGEHFVLFKPRDIVSGDFYWATQRGNKTVIVAADCTGHGVPGAFMSMLGISFLNEIVNKEEVLQANIILNRLRENVKRSLRQTGKENEAKDGMDLALCILDMEKMELQFAGAYNPLYLLRDGEIQKVKADRMPIGIYLREKESFANNIVKIQKRRLFVYIL